MPDFNAKNDERRAEGRREDGGLQCRGAKTGLA